MTNLFFDYDQAIERLDGDEEFLIELLNELVEQVDESWPVFEKALSEDDYDSMRAQAHSIKGAAANLSVDKMAEVFAIIENLGRSKTVEGADGYLGEVRELNESLREFLKHRNI